MKLNKCNGWVGLQGLQLQGSVGVYNSERIKGNKLKLDIWIFGDLKLAISSNELNDAFNYEVFESIAVEEVEKGSSLLEPLAYRILERIIKEFPEVKKAKIKVMKLSPPITSPCQASVVKLKLSRKQLVNQA